MKELQIFLENMFPAVDFTNEKKLVENKIFDSLDLFTLIAALEQKYKISIPMEEIAPENFNSVESLFSLMGRLSGTKDNNT